MKHSARSIQTECDSIRQLLTDVGNALGLQGDVDHGKIHPHGPVNIDAVQMQFTERVTRVKTALLRARHWSAADASKRLLNLSKDKALEDVKLKSLKSSVVTCQQLAASYLERETRASSGDHVISERLKQIVAKLEHDKFRLYLETIDHGDELLVTAVNSSPKISVTITCPSYLIDIVIHNGAVQSLTLQLSVQDFERHDEHFADKLLQTLTRQQFSEFERLLINLHRRYQVLDDTRDLFLAQGPSSTSVDVKRMLFTFEDDFARICQHESAVFGAEQSLTRHHGQLMCEDSRGRYLRYHCTALALVEARDRLAQLSRDHAGTYCLALSVELDSTLSRLMNDTYQLPVDTQIDSLNGSVNASTGHSVVFKSDHVTRVPRTASDTCQITTLSYAMTLDQGLVLATESLQAIHSVIAGRGVTGVINHVDLNHVLNEDMTALLSTESGNLGVSLIDLLIAQARDQSRDTLTVQNDIHELQADIHLDHVLDDLSTRVTHRYVMSHVTPSDIPAVTINRIPFTHISQVHPVLQILRQQLVFSELLSSCFISPLQRPVTDTMTPDTCEVIEIVTLRNNYLLLNLVPRDSHAVIPLSVEINVQLNGEIVVSSAEPSLTPTVTRVSEVLTVTRNIPLFVHELLVNLSK